MRLASNVYGSREPSCTDGMMASGKSVVSEMLSCSETRPRRRSASACAKRRHSSLLPIILVSQYIQMPLLSRYRLYSNHMFMFCSVGGSSVRVNADVEQ